MDSAAQRPCIACCPYTETFNLDLIFYPQRRDLVVVVVGENLKLQKSQKIDTFSQQDSNLSLYLPPLNNHQF